MTVLAGAIGGSCGLPLRARDRIRSTTRRLAHDLMAADGPCTTAPHRMTGRRRRQAVAARCSSQERPSAHARAGATARSASRSTADPAQIARTLPGPGRGRRPGHDRHHGDPPVDSLAAIASTRSASRSMAGSTTWPFRTGVAVPLAVRASITVRACATAAGPGVKTVLIAASCTACSRDDPGGGLRVLQDVGHDPDLVRGFALRNDDCVRPVAAFMKREQVTQAVDRSRAVDAQDPHEIRVRQLPQEVQAASRACGLSAGATVDSRSTMIASPPEVRASGKISGRDPGVRRKLRHARSRVQSGEVPCLCWPSFSPFRCVLKSPHLMAMNAPAARSAGPARGTAGSTGRATGCGM